MSDFNVSVTVPSGFGTYMQAKLNNYAKMAVQSTLIATKARWEQEAQKKLHTTRADYILGLNADNSIEYPDDYTGILTLRGKWANMLETGFDPFDIKDGFSHSKYAKQRKDGSGWYLTVPYRHRTTPTSGVGVGGRVMPKDIYAQAKKLNAGQRLTGTESKYPAVTSWKGYQHKNGIYEGMVKNTKQYGKATQSTYVTFRRASDKSDPSSWWHSGFAGVHAMDTVTSFAQETFSKMISNFLKNV